MTVYNYNANRLNGQPQSLNEYRGKVLLIVNTASKCGFTPQYKGLQELYDTYRDQGLEILGFPCNQFNHQEPGDSDEIATFCQANYGVKFPMFEKIDVNGENAHPLYKYMTEQAPGLLFKSIKWNFTKFLIDREGRVIARFAPTTKPEAIKAAIEQLL